MLIYLNMENLGAFKTTWSEEDMSNLLFLIGHHLEKYFLIPTTINKKHQHLLTDLKAFDALYRNLKHIERDIYRVTPTLLTMFSQLTGEVNLSYTMMGNIPHVILQVSNNVNENQTTSMATFQTVRTNTIPQFA